MLFVFVPAAVDVCFQAWPAVTASNIPKDTSAQSFVLFSCERALTLLEGGNRDCSCFTWGRSPGSCNMWVGDGVSIHAVEGTDTPLGVGVESNLLITHVVSCWDRRGDSWWVFQRFLVPCHVLLLSCAFCGILCPAGDSAGRPAACTDP